MSSNITLKRVKEKKRELAGEITKLIGEFQQETGTTVESIYLDNPEIIGETPPEVTFINIEVKI